MASMIEFLSVSKSYWTGQRRKVILDRATFRIEPGRSIGVLAANGTGKTTLINMMCGLEPEDEGRVTRSCRVSFPIGTLAGLDPKLNAVENVRYLARLYGLDPDYVESFCRYLAGLNDYFERPLRDYSSGMRARLNFAAMLALDFDIYLIDEGMPSTTDAEFNRRAMPILQQRLARAGAVVVSHKPAVLERFCTSAAVLKDGRLRFFDRLRDAREVYDYAA